MRLSKIYEIFYERNDIDEEWIQAAVAPTSDAQQYCIIWLQDHFSKFGDRAPNRYETYLIITARRNVYKDYVAEFKQRKQPYVQESVFSNLWVTIFPRYINRPWCDIPGTFATYDQHTLV